MSESKKLNKLSPDNLRKESVIIVPKYEKEFIISEETVMTYFQPILDRERKKEKNPAPYISPDIWEWRVFKGKKILGMSEELNSTIYTSLETTTHAKILGEAETKGLRGYTYLEAIAVVLAGVLANKIDERNTGFHVPFKMEGNSQLYYFFAGRDENGQLGIIVYKMRPKQKFVSSVV
jgi:hypothetical protein